MQNLGNNLRFTISIQITIVEFIIVVFGGIVVASIVTSSWMLWACALVVAGHVTATITACVAGTKFYRVARAGLTEQAVLSVLRGEV